MRIRALHHRPGGFAGHGGGGGGGSPCCCLPRKRRRPSLLSICCCLVVLVLVIHHSGNSSVVKVPLLVNDLLPATGNGDTAAPSPSSTSLSSSSSTPSVLLPASMAALKEHGGMMAEGAAGLPSRRSVAAGAGAATNGAPALSNRCSSSGGKGNENGGGVCHRVLVRFHKMGTVLVQELFGNKNRLSVRFKGKAVNEETLRSGKAINVDPDQHQPVKRKYVLSFVGSDGSTEDFGSNRIIGGGGGPAPGRDDFRMVVVMRNIFDSLVSGYLYHKSGRECYKKPSDTDDVVRNVTRVGGAVWTIRDWRHFAFKSRSYSYDILRTSEGTKTGCNSDGGGDACSSLCSFLALNSIEDGMRAYVEFAIRTKYRTLLDLVGAIRSGNRQQLSPDASDDGNDDNAKRILALSDRIKFVCYEDLVSSSPASATTMEGITNFMWEKGARDGDGTNFMWEKGARDGDGDTNDSSGNTVAAAAAKSAGAIDSESAGGNNNNRPASSVYTGGHATSRDPALRGRLLNAIKEIDARYYHGDIAWLNKSVVTCY